MKWVCHRCETINEDEKPKCVVCDYPRDKVKSVTDGMRIPIAADVPRASPKIDEVKSVSEDRPARSERTGIESLRGSSVDSRKKRKTKIAHRELLTRLLGKWAALFSVVGLIAGAIWGTSRTRNSPPVVQPPLVMVPQIIGKPLADARKIIEETGLEFREASLRLNDDTILIDNVISVTPPVGRSVHKGDAVTITLSAGSTLVKVPDVMGKPLTEARSMIEEMKLTCQIARERDANDVIPVDSVLRVEPPVGEKISKNKTVTLYLSAGIAPKVSPGPDELSKEVVPLQPDWVRNWIKKGWLNVEYDRDRHDLASVVETYQMKVTEVKYRGGQDTDTAEWTVVGKYKNADADEGQFSLEIFHNGTVTGLIGLNHSSLQDWLEGNVDDTSILLKRSSPYTFFGTITIPLRKQSLLKTSQGEQVPASTRTSQVPTRYLRFPPSPHKGDIISNPVDGAEVAFIPEGTFMMGDDALEGYEPKQSPVHLDGYWIYRKHVTVGMYKKFCLETKRRMPPAPPGFNPGWRREDHPIVNVSWKDAEDYCKWAGTRLPTEAEWEHAARGPQGYRFPWGNKFDEKKLWCSRSDYSSAGGTTSVGQYPPNDFGLYDMAGNASQWCTNDNTREDNHASRGGGWQTHPSMFFYFASGHSSPKDEDHGMGFRCAVTYAE